MTILVLDPGADPLPPYPEWLAGDEDLVLFTGAPDGAAAPGYAEVRRFSDYATSARVETQAVELAARTGLSGIVATAHADLIRAGALRAHLGLPGLHREQSMALADLVGQRRTLDAAGIRVVPCAPLREPSDLYGYAHLWQRPVRVRSRRVAGWPTVCVLHDEKEMAEFAATAFADGWDSRPDLLLEPDQGAVPHSGVAGSGGDAVLPPAVSAQLPLEDGCEHLVTWYDAADSGVVIDAVALRPAIGPDAARDRVRAQVGRFSTRREQVG